MKKAFVLLTALVVMIAAVSLSLGTWHQQQISTTGTVSIQYPYPPEYIGGYELVESWGFGIHNVQDPVYIKRTNGDVKLDLEETPFNLVRKPLYIKQAPALAL